MSSISQIVALQRRAAQLARAPQGSGSTDAVVRSAAALVTLGAARAPVTYTDRIKRTGNVNVGALLADGKHGFDDSGADGSVAAAVARSALTYSWIGSRADDVRNPQPGSPRPRHEEGHTFGRSNPTRTGAVDLRGGRFTAVGMRDPGAEATFSRVEHDRLMPGGRQVRDLPGTPGDTLANKLFVAAGSRITAATVGSSTVRPRQVADGRWTLTAEPSAPTPMRRIADGDEVMPRGSVSLVGIEAVKLWDGAAAKGVGAALYNATA